MSIRVLQTLGYSRFFGLTGLAGLALLDMPENCIITQTRAEPRKMVLPQKLMIYLISVFTVYTQLETISKVSLNHLI